MNFTQLKYGLFKTIRNSSNELSDSDIRTLLGKYFNIIGNDIRRKENEIVQDKLKKKKLEEFLKNESQRNNTRK